MWCRFGTLLYRIRFGTVRYSSSDTLVRVRRREALVDSLEESLRARESGKRLRGPDADAREPPPPLDRRMSASPPEPPTIRDFILEATSQADVRSRWEAAFAEETAEQWVALERTALLKRLASLGIPLAERQRLANAVGRWRRKLEFAVKSRPVYLSADDVPQPAGGNATRQEIRQKILSEEDEDSVYTGGDGGMVRINTQGKPPLSTWAADFAECGDSSCGCYRLTWPHVRADFRNVVVLRTADAARRHGGALGAVRYVSVGCGSLLTDFEILCGLQAQRIPIASVCVADTAYEKLDQRHRSCF
jgi:hypothetical protein